MNRRGKYASSRQNSQGTYKKSSPAEIEQESNEREPA
jgi:hypothetical protein